MTKSYLNSEPYGTGELIARKKHLQVPPYQRDYAWGADEVDQLLEDTLAAIYDENEEYFLGLIVIFGPIENDWMILDGQQRLATCTMILAAVRYWLHQLSRSDDADQIQRQFISVRRLGGGDEPRLTMNHANRDLFAYLLSPALDSDQIRVARDSHAPGTSNYKLAEAFLACRSYIGNAITKTTPEAQDAFLYRLSDFLENQAQVVCLEVDQAADAYKIFESLNDRGMGLSALDLVKNFAFGTVEDNKHDALAEFWERMASQIVDSDAEDFLKVVWTAKFGRIQRGSLYTRIRSEYSTQNQVLDLVDTLAFQAELYTALSEPSHTVWADYGPATSSMVAILRDLRARQVRPIVLAALSKRVSSEVMNKLLSNLVSLTIRYQTVGRRRTGLLEIACAKAAKQLSAPDSELGSTLAELEHLVPTDEEFESDIGRYSERNTKRAAHVLLGIESFMRFGEYQPDWVNDSLSSKKIILAPLVSKYTIGNWAAPELKEPGFLEYIKSRLGNLFLLTPNEAKTLRSASFGDTQRILAEAFYQTSRLASDAMYSGAWGREQIQWRQSQLGATAVKCWRWEPAS